VPTGRQPGLGPVEVGQVRPGGVEQGRHLGPLEPDGVALGVVLVVGDLQGGLLRLGVRATQATMSSRLRDRSATRAAVRSRSAASTASSSACVA